MQLRPRLGEVFRRLAEQKKSRVLEGHLMADRAHMLLSIPPKYARRYRRGLIVERIPDAIPLAAPQSFAYYFPISVHNLFRVFS